MAENSELLRRAGAMDVPEDDGADHLRADILGSIVGSDPRLPNYLGRINNLITAHGAVGKKTDMTPPAAPVPGGDPGMTAAPSATPTATPDTSAPLMGAKPQRSFLGNIGRVAARMGNIAGDIFAPGITALIPGTDLNKKIAAEKAEATSERQRKLATEEKRAGTEEERAQTEAAKEKREAEAAGQPKPKEESWELSKDYTGPNGEPVEIEKNSGTLRIAGSGITGIKRVSEKPETQEQNKLAFQSVIGKIDAAGLPTDPKSLPKSLNQAVKRGAIKPEEHQAAAAYLAANPTPTTTVQVQTAGAETKEAIHDANTYYRWADASGVHAAKGNKVPAGVDAEPIGGDKEFAQHLREGRAANIVQQSLNRVAQDVDEHPELFDNAAARNILATSLQQIDRSSAGILIAGTGGSIPLPSGLGSMINTALQNKALDAKTARAVKDYVADYKAMKDKAIVQQMEMQGGKIGRGSAQAFEAIVNQLPNGDTADSTTARRQVFNMQQTQDELAKNYGEYGDFKKEKPYKPKAGGSTGGGHNFTVNGVQFSGVSDEDYNRAKKLKGFKE